MGGLILKRSESVVTQSCLALCHPVDCSLSGSSIPGIFQASELPFPSPGDLSHPGNLPDPGLLHCRQTLYCLNHQGSHLNENQDNNLEERMNIENNHSVDKSWWYFHIYFRTKVLCHFYNFFLLKSSMVFER